MMNYLQDIKPLEDLGRTDEEIAAILGTIRSSFVPLSELEAKLTLWGILTRDPETNARQGVLVDVAKGTSPLKAVAVQVLSWLGSSRSQQVSTQTAEVAPLWAQGLSGMVAGGVLTQAQADSLNALAGSLVYPNLTALDVAQSRTDYQTAEAARVAAEQLAILRDGYRSQFDAILNQIGTAEQPAAVVSLRAIADALEV